ncbi:MAG: hypothetical protein HYU66_06690 [Armatimonadetes bacterium]|nr:hypothetical protein [Armatimonadota bacterium]
MVCRLLMPCILLASAWSAAADVARFDFGTPDSAIRPGFTRVTPADVFSAAKGYGFESGDGLTAYDRGGSQIALPADAHTASAYGASRSTTDLTCDLIEGERDNAFVVSLPDGDRTVWLIAGDPDWDPPLFEVWAGGRKQLDVRVPRARFVNVGSFRAQAVGGLLRIELKGSRGWLLNGLVIGQDGAELDDVVGKLRRDIFFLTDPELPNWREETPAPPARPLTWSAAEQQRGYVIFPVDYTQPVVRSFVPVREAVGRPLTAFATPGEFEPASFCVFARSDLGEVKVELASFTDGNRHSIGPEHVTAGTVRCVPKLVAARERAGEHARVAPAGPPVHAPAAGGQALGHVAGVLPAVRRPARARAPRAQHRRRAGPSVAHRHPRLP